MYDRRSQCVCRKIVLDPLEADEIKRANELVSPGAASAMLTTHVQVSNMDETRQ
jgi:hypothetical protein